MKASEGAKLTLWDILQSEPNMTSPDIRWKQRFDNYVRALAVLESAVSLTKSRSLSDLEKQGLIQSFEFCHELAWNLVKDYLEHQGFSAIIGSRDAMREAYNRGLITHGDDWMDMIRSRNLSTHTYNRKIADEIASKIVDTYFGRFVELRTKFYSFG